MKKYFYLFTSFVILSTNLFADGAGVLPMTIDPNGEAVFLLGKECRYSKQKKYESWSDFGGKQDREESLNQTAYREFTEETGYKNFPHITQKHIDESPYVDYNSTKGSYRLYFLNVTSPFLSAENVKKTANEVKAQYRAKRKRDCIEKTDWRYLNAEQLLNVINDGKRGFKYLPDTNNTEVIFGLFSDVLQQDLSREIVEGFIEKAKTIKDQTDVLQQEPSLEIVEGFIEKAKPIKDQTNISKTAVPTKTNLITITPKMPSREIVKGLIKKAKPIKDQTNISKTAVPTKTNLITQIPIAKPLSITPKIVNITSEPKKVTTTQPIIPTPLATTSLPKTVMTITPIKKLIPNNTKKSDILRKKKTVAKKNLFVRKGKISKPSVRTKQINKTRISVKNSHSQTINKKLRLKGQSSLKVIIKSKKKPFAKQSTLIKKRHLSKK